MSSPDLDPDLERQSELEERAHQIRMTMFRDAEFMAGIREGLAQAEAGETLTLDEFERALDEP